MHLLGGWYCSKSVFGDVLFDTCVLNGACARPSHQTKPSMNRSTCTNIVSVSQVCLALNHHRLPFIARTHTTDHFHPKTSHHHDQRCTNNNNNNSNHHHQHHHHNHHHHRWRHCRHRRHRQRHTDETKCFDSSYF